MKKAKLNAFVDIFSFFAFLGSSFSGIVLWQVFPRGGGLSGERELLADHFFLGIASHDWRNIHQIIGLILIILILCHLILHWDWIKNLPKILRR